MSGQTTVDPPANGAAGSDRESGVRRVINDVIELAELQMQLAALDSREATRHSILAVACGAVGLAALLAVLVVALTGGGWVLHEQAGWSVGLSLLVMAGVGLIVTLLLMGAAYLAIRRALASMQETSAEFRENLKWLKAVFVAPSSPRNRMRAPREVVDQPSSGHRF